MAEPKQTAAQRYAAVKPIKFNNPFSSWQEFQTQVGMPVTWAWNGLLRVGNWVDNSKFGKWANQSTPRPVQRILPSVNERASIPNAGSKPLTAEEVAQVLAERRAGVLNIPIPEIPTPPSAPQPAPVAPAKPAYPGLFSGDLRSLNARRNWVGLNADYLRAQGWSNEDIEGYKGLNLTNAQRASLNLRLARVLGGANDWYAQQAEAGRRMNEGLTKLEAPITSPAPVSASAVPIKIAGPAMKKKGGIVKDKEPAQPIKKVGDVTYTLKNDSSFVWNGPNNSAGEVRLYPTSGKEPDVTYRQYDMNNGKRKVMVDITDPTIRQKHIDNVQSGGFKVPGLIRRTINRLRGTGELKTGGNVNYQKIFR